uniref:(2Fe-2S)-binding protein n=1 Tax=Acidobacterium capsulatum TaxID=33075 RepID=A0A7V4XU06_9BACT
MPELISLRINHRLVQVAYGTSVAAALMQQEAGCRISVTGETRGPLCGMGICYECRVTINGVPDRLSCRIPCAEGMAVRTDE